MLLIDGVKYELWTPPSEDEFEQVVKEHAQDIFGKESIYLDRKQKLGHCQESVQYLMDTLSSLETYHNGT